MRRVLGDFALYGAMAVWASGIAAGFYALEEYDHTPGDAGTLAAQEALAPPTAGAAPWLLEVFIHPLCPCSRASLTELCALARDLPPRVAVRVLFVRPEGTPEGWERSSLWESAAAIPNATVGTDVGGASAHGAGAATSGHAVLRDAAGRVVFRGGITAGRGRTGESAGRRAIRDLVAGSPNQSEARVYGCPLHAPQSCSTEGSAPCQNP